MRRFPQTQWSWVLSGVVTASVVAVVVIVGVAAVLEICNVLHDVKKRKY